MTIEKTGWLQSFGVYRDKRVVTLLFLGFSSGLPILLVFGTLSYWLREAGVSRSTIGFVSWVALAYAFKWVWSPLVDRLTLPVLGKMLGRRRSWLLTSQLILVFTIFYMAQIDPASNLEGLVWAAVVVAFFSATQDIVVDAFRIESGDTRIQAAMASTYMIGYRLAMMMASAGVLWLAAMADGDVTTYRFESWQFAYQIMAGLMLTGVLTTLLAREPDVVIDDSTREREARAVHWIDRHIGPLSKVLDWIWVAIVSPFSDFILRYRWHAVLLLLLISTYRISDIVLGVVSNVFYVDMGFSKNEVATVTKVFGVVMTLLGSILGGVMVNRFGVMKILFLGALLSSVTNLLFALLAGIGHDVNWLIGVVSMDNLSAGIATAAFIAYLSGLTNVSYSATQYALFSSVMLLFPKFIGGYSGVMVDAVDYPWFFTLTAMMGLPVLLLIILSWHFEKKLETGS